MIENTLMLFEKNKFPVLMGFFFHKTTYYCGSTKVLRYKRESHELFLV